MTTSTAKVEQYLQGVTYPASKDELITQARENQAPDDVVFTLEELPMDTFEGTEDVAKALGEPE